MSARLRVGLAFGGRSVEHEVSVASARGVDAALRETTLVCVPIGVCGDGRWLGPERSRQVLDGATARVEPADPDDGERVLLDPGGGGLVASVPGAPPRSLGIDVLFPLVHGWGGEDGRFQGALELAGVPYVGSGVLGSALGMDKAAAKELFAARGIPVVPWRLVLRDEWAAEPDAVEARLEAALGMPVFVKPSNGGSSVGISKVRRLDELRAALEAGFAHDRRVVVERGVDAREIECGVVGNDRPEVSGFGEIAPSGEFYDYAAKYLDGRSGLTIPAALAPEQERAMRAAAAEAYRALDLAGFARVDFLVDRGDGTAYLNEVNTLPGFTTISMFPKLWQFAGLAYPRLIERLVELALERSRQRAALRTRRDET